MVFSRESQLSHLSQRKIIMNILDLAETLNLSPRRTASTSGGEYKSKCPKCQDGIDRFCIWPNQGKSGRYWCRVCEAKGDGIQFCRDFLGMTFHEACQKLKFIPSPSNAPLIKRKAFVPHTPIPTTSLWQHAAKYYIASSHKRLMAQPKVIEYLASRGFTLDTIQRFSLGWNSQDLFEERERWGMLAEIKENGHLKRQWLPKGIVIPTFVNNEPTKIKIRRSTWTSEDSLPKYIEISGSSQTLSIYGDKSKPVIIVESELDAMLIQQKAAHLICSLALGGVSKKPDEETHKWLQQAPLILLCLDFDDAGKKRCAFWMKQYLNLRPWPIPFAKSSGDVIKLFNINFVSWVKNGLF